MRFTINFTTLVFSFSSLMFCAFSAAEQRNTDAFLIGEINIILSEQKKNEPGINVLIRKHNEVIFKASKGIANFANTERISSATGFRIGSISKPFTALAIMQLVEREKLSLESEARSYFPQLSESWKDVTIKHLLSHRVSLSKDFFSDSNLSLANGSTNHELIKFLSTESVDVRALAFDEAVYCNSCYVLLAEIISKVSGMGFAAYMRDNIFIPAGMQNSQIIEKGKRLQPSDALNYAKTETFFGIKQYTTGAMAQVSSIDDFNNFIEALKQGNIVSKATLNLMTQVHSDAGDDGTFGLGWVIGWGEPAFFSHGGSQDGYQSELFFHPKHDIEVVILSNGGEQTYAIQAKLMRAIITHYK